MPDLWFPGAERWNTGRTRFDAMGPGRTRKAVHHSIEGENIYGAAAWLDRSGDYYTLLVAGSGPRKGKAIQFCPANLAARSMRNGGLFDGGCNRYGELCIQVAWEGFAKDDPMLHADPEVLDAVFKWLDSWGVPRVMPSGPFDNDRKVVDDWLRKSGHYSHSQAPGNPSRFDPGRPPRLLTNIQEDDMPNYATLRRGGFTLQPGQAVWVNYTKASNSAQPIHTGRGSVLRRIDSYSATLELPNSGGDLQLDWCEVDGDDRSKVVTVDRQRQDSVKASFSNVGGLGKRNLRLRLSNRSDHQVRIDRAELRLLWW